MHWPWTDSLGIFLERRARLKKAFVIPILITRSFLLRRDG
jgi:hypothetical protein